MPRHTEGKDNIRYACSRCGAKHAREDMSVKRSVFLTFGQNPSTLRSRVIAWLCEDCRNSDSDWTRDRSRGGSSVSTGRNNA